MQQSERFSDRKHFRASSCDRRFAAAGSIAANARVCPAKRSISGSQNSLTLRFAYGVWHESGARERWAVEVVGTGKSASRGRTRSGPCSRSPGRSSAGRRALCAPSPCIRASWAGRRSIWSVGRTLESNAFTSTITCWHRVPDFVIICCALFRSDLAASGVEGAEWAVSDNQGSSGVAVGRWGWSAPGR